MADTITLSGDYGTNIYKLKQTTADVIDASDASWTLANMGSNANPYPFQIVGADSQLRVIGGTINGQVTQTMDWEDAYINSAALRLESAPQVTVEDWRIDKAWDGIRLTGSSNNFTIENVWLSNIRDDGIENDAALGGTVRDSLFDGVFVGLSTDGSADGSDNVVTLDGVLMRSESYLYKGEVTHQSLFKFDKEGGNPSLKVIDSVLAIENPDHEGYARLEEAFSQMTEVKNSYYLNLSDDPLPSDYPDIPKGFTVLQGQEARDYWEASRAEWIEEHTGEASTAPETGAEVTPVPTPETTTPEPDTDTGAAVPGTGTEGGDAVAATSGVTEVRISSDLDDAEEGARGKMDLDSSDIEMTLYKSASQTVGLRFDKLDIPEDAVITKAYLQFQVDEASSGRAALQIRGEASDDAAAFSKTAYDLSSRETTDAKVDWQPENWTKVGAEHQTDDLSDVIQEIIDREGWEADNALALVITGSGKRVAESYKGDADAAPLLHVEWEVPGDDATAHLADGTVPGYADLYV